MPCLNYWVLCPADQKTNCEQGLSFLTDFPRELSTDGKYPATHAGGYGLIEDEGPYSMQAIQTYVAENALPIEFIQNAGNENPTELIFQAKNLKLIESKGPFDA